jgi:hypothetical protein
MSLVNDALRKARLEAARQEVDRSGAILPTLGQVRKGDEQEFFTPGLLVLLTLGALALAVVLFVTMSRDTESRPETDVAESGIPSAQAVIEGTDIDTAAKEAAVTETRSTAVEATIREPAAGEAAPSRTPAPPEAAPIPAPATAGQRRPASQSGRVEPARAFPSKPEVTQTASASSSEPFQTTRTPQSLTDNPAPQRSTLPPASEPAVPVDQVSRPPSADEIKPTDSESPARSSPAGDVATGRLESFLREADIPGVGSFRLDGIAWSSDRPFALINGEVIGPGGVVDGATVIEVAPDRVILERDTSQFEIRLR